MSLTQAIYSVLAADSTLQGLLSTYDPPGAGAPVPAIFTDPIPEEAEAPFVVLSGEVAQEPFDTNEEYGRNVLYDIRCYAEQDGSRALLDSIAERVRALLHDRPLSVVGIGHVMTRMSGPIRNDAVDLYGAVLTARVLLSE